MKEKSDQERNLQQVLRNLQGDRIEAQRYDAILRVWDSEEDYKQHKNLFQPENSSSA
jgi:hypothetical protein